MNRRLFVLLLPIALVLAVVADQSRPAADAPRFGSRLGIPSPVARVDPRLSSTWYCPGLPARAPGSGVVHVLNPGQEVVTATISIFENEVAEPTVTQTDLAPGASTTVDVGTLRPADVDAVLVEAVGGEVIVESVATTADGSGGSACASDVAPVWYLAEGSTDDAPDGGDGASYRLAIFNPFVADAVVDVEFFTPAGPTFAQDTEALVIPPRSLQVINVNEAVRREDQVAARVTTRSGAVVAGRLLSYDGSGSREGVIAGVAASTLSTSWWFAGGGVDDGVDERVVIANPNDDRSELELNVYPADTSAGAPTPLAVSVPPRSSYVVDVASIAGMVPGPHALQLESLNGIGVVAERVIDETTGDGRRTSAVVGAPVVASQWYLADGSPSASVSDEVLAVVNPTGDAVTVDVRQILAGGSSRQVAEVELAGGAMVRVPLGAVSPTERITLWVRAGTPVVVERKQREGVPWTMAVPAQ